MKGKETKRRRKRRLKNPVDFSGINLDQRTKTFRNRKKQKGMQLKHA
jgi:hypothetical protein